MFNVIKLFKNIVLLYRFDAAMRKMWRAWEYIDDWRAEELLWAVILEMEECRQHLFEPQLGTCIGANGARSPKGHYETSECDDWRENESI